MHRAIQSPRPYMTMRKRISKEDGFSYIDVMIAIVIMLVGVLALVGALAANVIFLGIVVLNGLGAALNVVCRQS